MAPQLQENTAVLRGTQLSGRVWKGHWLQIGQPPSSPRKSVSLDATGRLNPEPSLVHRRTRVQNCSAKRVLRKAGEHRHCVCTWLSARNAALACGRAGVYVRACASLHNVTRAVTQIQQKWEGMESSGELGTCAFVSPFRRFTSDSRRRA